MDLFVDISGLWWLPSTFVCISVLTYGSLSALDQEKQMHDYVTQTNLDTNYYVKNELIDMYSKCDSSVDTRIMFNIIDDTNIISYNAMIEESTRHSGYMSPFTYSIW